jgi:hypothetical protein
MNRILLKISFLTLISALGCSTLPAGKQTIEPAPASRLSAPSQNITEPDVAVSELFRTLPLVENEKRVGMERAWKQIPNYDHYRKARPSDFVTAGWKENESDRSYEYGEIAGAYGLGLFVVDKTLPKPKNFSFVIFVERPRNRYDIYWIYRDENLSGFNLSRSSGDIFLRGVSENGMPIDCEVQWSKNSGKWTCE